MTNEGSNNWVVNFAVRWTLQLLKNYETHSAKQLILLYNKHIKLAPITRDEQHRCLASYVHHNQTAQHNVSAVNTKHRRSSQLPAEEPHGP